jgi:hypothetical protein
MARPIKSRSTKVHTSHSKDSLKKQALTAWIDQEQDHHFMTHDALADVDASRVTNHQAIQDWADSLSDGDPTQRLLPDMPL